MWKKLVAAVAVLGAAAPAAGIEEPRYEVVEKTEEYELRRYEPYMVAQTVVEGRFERAGNRAFEILAGYIFGQNREGARMAMTAPVFSSDDAGTPAMESTMLATRSGTGDEFVYQFVMESKYTRESLPKPLNSLVEILEIPARTVAVRSYSGSWREARYRAEEAALLEALDEAGIQVTGPPQFARYDAPMIPSAERRNEVIIPVQR